jgi:hypothetical protein
MVSSVFRSIGRMPFCACAPSFVDCFEGGEISLIAQSFSGGSDAVVGQ